MDLLSALVEADALPSELLQQMFVTDAVASVKEQQVIISVLSMFSGALEN